MPEKRTYRALSELVADPRGFAKAFSDVPCVHQGSSSRLNRLLSIHDCDVLIGERALRTPAVQMAKDGRRLPPHRYTWAPLRSEVGVSDEIRPAAVKHELELGATLVINGLDRLWPPAKDFCQRLGFELGFPVHANAYLTPPEAQGFRHHHDADSVFIVQTSGSKTWQLFEPVLGFPLGRYHDWPSIQLSAADQARLNDGRPDLEIRLEPGDVLWLPRGWIHNGFAESTASLHVTVALHRPTRHWVLKELVDWLATEEELRLDVATGFGADVTTVTRTIEEVLAMVASLGAERIASSAAKYVLERHRARFPEGKLATPVSTAVGESKGLVDQYHVIPQTVVGIDRGDDRISLHLGDREIVMTGPGAAMAAELVARDDTTISASDLKTSFGSEADEVCNALVREEILSPAGEDQEQR